MRTAARQQTVPLDTPPMPTRAKVTIRGPEQGAGSPGEAGRRGVTALSQERAAQAAGGDGLGNRGAVGTGVALGELGVLEGSGWMPGFQVWT